MLAAPPPTLTGCSTVASPRSVDLCLAVRGLAGEGPGALADRKSAAVAESCYWRELSSRWPWATVRWGTATGLAGLNGGGRCRRTACGTRWSSAVVRCRDGLGYYKRSNVVRIWFRYLRREEAEGMLQPEMGLTLMKKNGRGNRSPWPVGGTEPLGRLPCLFHWFLPGRGCRGRREGAATLTPLLCHTKQV